MCTVSIIPIPSMGGDSAPKTIGFRLVCNRDEQHHRADATAPRWREVGGVRAIWPTDGEAGGTWISANELGLVLCLLNMNPMPAPGVPEGTISRGKIIPGLAMLGGVEGVLAGVRGLELDRYAPFRLLAVEGGEGEGARVVSASWDRRGLVVEEHRGGGVCLASSGLGDELARPRLELFEGMVVGGGMTPEAQDVFHAHRWPERPEVSVMMSRADARTVSVTHVEAAREGGAWRMRMRYRPVVEGVPKAMGALAAGSGGPR